MTENNNREAKKEELKRELEELEKGIASHVDRMKETEAKLKKRLVE